jgi:PAT family beta-lactamase induction signal transducer AmpG
MAHFTSWPVAYTVLAGCMLIGVVTTLLIPEPDHTVNRDTWQQEQSVIDFLERSAHLPHHLRHGWAWFIGAVVCPFTEFFQRNGAFALIILLFIGLFRVSDIAMGVMANPLYVDRGYSDLDIGLITKTVGPVITIIGALAGGAMVFRFGVFRVLLTGALLVVLTNALFVLLALLPPDRSWLAAVVAADNLAAGIAGSAFIAYLSGLTNRAYTATQYALFSSLMLLPAKFIGGFSGDVVQTWGYVPFFLYSACLGLPAIALIAWLMHHDDAPNSLKK